MRLAMRKTIRAIGLLGVLLIAHLWPDEALRASRSATLQPPAEAPVPTPMPAILQNYQSVTPDRLHHPSDADWLMVRRTYDGWGYSPLDQITPVNVAGLEPAWILSTGVLNGHEAPPIINKGVMFAATPGNQVIAIDAASGQLLWR